MNKVIDIKRQGEAFEKLNYLNKKRKIFSEIYEFKNGLNKEKEYFGYGNKILNYMDVNKNTVINGSEISGKVNCTNSELDRFSVTSNDLFFTRTSESSEEIGLSCAVDNIEEETVFSGFVLRARPTNIDTNSKYYSYLFRSTENRKKIIRHSSITTRALTSGTLIGEIKVASPNISIQNKIANFLTSLDELIQKQEEYIEKLKVQKKGYSQKIFNQELRFKGFEEELQQKDIDSIVNISTGKLDANAMVENGKYRFYTCAKEYYKINEYAFDDDVLLISGNGANVGYIHSYKGKFNAYQRTYVLSNFKCVKNYMNYYLHEFLKNRVLQTFNIGNTPFITKDVIGKMKITLPSLKEQKKIGDLLSTLDDKIKLQEQKLEQLKQKKKYYLNKIFQ